jgi:hypothetical protein
MGFLGRYLAGLCVAVLGLCAAGWLVLTPVAFDYHRWHSAALADRAGTTGDGDRLRAALDDIRVGAVVDSAGKIHQRA